jgi:hypothetical protein
MPSRWRSAAASTAMRRPDRLWRHRCRVSRQRLGDTFRAVYTVRLARSLFVLHAFQKKSKTGREAPQREMDLIRQRLREAEEIAKEIEP